MDVPLLLITDKRPSTTKPSTLSNTQKQEEGISNWPIYLNICNMPSNIFIAPRNASLSSPIRIS